MSKIEVDKIDPQSGTALEVGTSGDTVTVPSGVGLTLTDSTLLLPTTITSTTEVKTNKISPATGTAFALGDSGDTFTVPSGATIANLGTATGFSGAFESALLHVQDQKSQGSNGGSAGDNATVTRDLNTVLTNEITGASLATNQITLPSGTFFISAKAPASHCNSHQILLYNTSDASETLTGQNAYNSTAGTAESTTHSFLTGRFTIAAEKVFELRHRVNSNSPTVGLGRTYGGSNTPPHELFTDLNIWKVA